MKLNGFKTPNLDFLHAYYQVLRQSSIQNRREFSLSVIESAQEEHEGFLFEIKNLLEFLENNAITMLGCDLNHAQFECKLHKDIRLEYKYCPTVYTGRRNHTRKTLIYCKQTFDDEDTTTVNSNNPHDGCIDRVLRLLAKVKTNFEFLSHRSVHKWIAGEIKINEDDWLNLALTQSMENRIKKTLIRR